MSVRAGQNNVSLLCAAVLLSCSLGEVMGIDMKDGGEANVSRHLGIVGRVNLGSFYTPAKYVRMSADWMLKHGIGDGWTIADLSCGYGAFFELASVREFASCRFVGNDIDHQAVEKAHELFPFVECFERNALLCISRQAYRIGEKDRLIIVGNPPYNDVTSQINQKLKDVTTPMDSDVRTRDLGMSSLLAYNKLKADYVLVLHPLSYLIKKANFRATKQFFENYSLVEHVVFSSQEFAGTSKMAGFPVIVALYRRQEGCGLKYGEVQKLVFKTVEGNSFSLSGFDYVTDEIDKYPSDRRYDPEILFYTMRDINALRRSRTFLVERIANAVDIDPEKLAYYCYIDCFKRYASVPYYLGNFNVPYLRDEFQAISNDVVAVAKHSHPEIFGNTPEPTKETVDRIKEYIVKSIRGKAGYNAD